MKLPPLIYVLGYAGLIPFVAGPLWLMAAPGSAPVWLDRMWLNYAAMIASFMAGTLWGMAIFTAGGPNGLLGMALSTVLLLLAWAAMALPFKLALIALAAVFVLLVLAEIWRERVLDPLSGYFTLRLTLTLGVLACLGWRLLLGA
ncbi:MAG: hypothetical protein NVS9B10_23440 [Nevskia sp.]